ncbi:MAG: amylo-alpha-1,6-glucosidase [Cyanophyceae cyanobacterium]
MKLELKREICRHVAHSQRREWLVTNGIGGYASGTVAGLVTRGYHGWLVAALEPPLKRTVLLTKIDETAWYDGSFYPLFANCWADGTVEPQAHAPCEFYLEGTVPVWRYALADAQLEKRIWMQQGANTTYVRYSLQRGSKPLYLSLKALVNYRSYHSRTKAQGWQMNIESTGRGVRVVAFPEATPLYLLADRGETCIVNEWHYGFKLVSERQRGLDDLDDNLHAATLAATLEPGDSLTLVASTQSTPVNGAARFAQRQAEEKKLLATWQTAYPIAEQAPAWIKHLVLAADQFIVDRPLPDRQRGKTMIAGYHWFTDWGRDTTISLPGLTLATGRWDVARLILKTFAQYIDRGMLPNYFPDPENGTTLSNAAYNTVDATLWYFEAIRAYHVLTEDDELLQELFPVLAEIIDWHCQGTRYNIQLDLNDGLLYAGKAGVQLTWMDVKVDDWVVTPRIGKPVEVNALWYNALRAMSQFAQRLGRFHQQYEAIAQTTRKGFRRFWSQQHHYCFDVLDGPDGDDATLRPNQIFAVSLPESPLSADQQRQIVAVCERELLTPYGLRSLAPRHPQYQGYYDGDRHQRDGAYHQGTAWAWLIGPFVIAHLRVYNDPARARQFLEPMAHHLCDAGVGSISEIFDGNAPFKPKGCIAQAWSVAEVLRAWLATQSADGAGRAPQAQGGERAKGKGG